MAIRKPVLSVQEARQLAIQRTKPVLVEALPPMGFALPEIEQALQTTSEVPTTQLTPDASLTPVQADVGIEPVIETLVAMEALPPLLEPELTQSVSSSVVIRSDGVKPQTSKLSRKPVIKPKPDINKPTLPALSTLSTEERMQVFLSAAFPAVGVSHSFDLLCRQYPPGKALQMILRRALDDYEVILENGELDALPEAYVEARPPETPGIIQTSRIMPVRLIERAKAHFDPLGFESDRAFGRKLGSAALAIFFEIQAQNY